ncbi:MAG TPA: hypothetical protein VF783_05660 [Terriglobales bacterium]
MVSRLFLSRCPTHRVTDVTNNDIAYPRSTCAAGMRDGHGTVYVDARNDVEVR